MCENTVSDRRRATKEIGPEASANHFCEIGGRLESILRRNDLLKSFHTAKTQLGHRQATFAAMHERDLLSARE